MYVVNKYMFRMISLRGDIWLMVRQMNMIKLYILVTEYGTKQQIVYINEKR